jgi:NitT/TauT family transport system substrate-binding protein
MKKHFFIYFIIMLFIFGCSSKKDDTIVISTNSWIGYTPLFYAKEIGWLDALNIKLINVVSLAENKHLYDSGGSHAFSGTQYEFLQMHQKDPSLIPIIMFDRSNGGDVILSNTTLEKLQNSKEKIDAYLEVDSVNFIVLESFLDRYGVDKNRINYINKDQGVISTLRSEKLSNTTLIVTYTPYNIKLINSGFHLIASTAEDSDIAVFDGLYISKDLYFEHQERFMALKGMIDDAIAVLDQDPRTYYEKVKYYLDMPSFEAFSDSLHDIEWIHSNRTQKMQERMKRAHYPTEDIL